MKKTPSGCWEWQKYRTIAGYGQLRFRGRTTAAHRLAWELANGPIPEGLHVLHHCDNPPCCNPAHLFTGDDQANAQDAVRKGRHSSMVHPESRPRGSGHYSRRRPERLTRGESFWSAKMTDAKVREARRVYASGGISMQRVATMFDLGPWAMREILQFRSWKHVV